MKAISIRQPWAWMILHCGKDIENRDWPTKIRGRVLIHASKGLTQDEYSNAWKFAMSIGVPFPEVNFGDIIRGGIVGSVEIIDCIQDSESEWFFGAHGFVLRDPKPLPFIPWKGSLGFFNVPDEVVGA